MSEGGREMWPNRPCLGRHVGCRAANDRHELADVPDTLANNVPERGTLNGGSPG